MNLYLSPRKVTDMENTLVDDAAMEEYLIVFPCFDKEIKGNELL